MGVGAGGGGGAPGAALAALEGEADYWASLRDLREAVAWAGERSPAGRAAAEGGAGGRGGPAGSGADSVEALREEARECLERNRVAARIRNRVGALRERQDGGGGAGVAGGAGEGGRTGGGALQGGGSAWPPSAAGSPSSCRTV